MRVILGGSPPVKKPGIQAQGRIRSSGSSGSGAEVWRRLLLRLMRRSEKAAPDWSARSTRVLFLRHDRAGDMILTTGIMRAIARSHDTIELDVLASPLNAPILDESDFVRGVITIDIRHPATYWRAVRQMRRAHYDAVIDCMPTGASVTTLLLMAASGATPIASAWTSAASTRRSFIKRSQRQPRRGTYHRVPDPADAAVWRSALGRGEAAGAAAERARTGGRASHLGREEARVNERFGRNVATRLAGRELRGRCSAPAGSQS